MTTPRFIIILNVNRKKNFSSIEIHFLFIYCLLLSVFNMKSYMRKKRVSYLYLFFWKIVNTCSNLKLIACEMHKRSSKWKWKWEKAFLVLHSDKHAIGQLGDARFYCIEHTYERGLKNRFLIMPISHHMTHVSLLPVAAAFSLFYGFLTFMCMQLSFDFYINETEAASSSSLPEKKDLFMWLSTHVFRSKWTIKNLARVM